MYCHAFLVAAKVIGGIFTTGKLTTGKLKTRKFIHASTPLSD